MAGRPRQHSKIRIDTLRALWPELRTERSLQNRAYALDAWEILDRDEFRYIVPTRETCEAQGIPWVMLEKLGRVGCEDTIRALASEICQRKLTTREAVSYIRLATGGEKPQGDQLDLTMALARTLQDYEATHDVSDELVALCLVNIAGHLEDSPRIKEIFSEIECLSMECFE
jgi:hypothetical protein